MVCTITGMFPLGGVPDIAALRQHTHQPLLTSFALLLVVPLSCPCCPYRLQLLLLLRPRQPGQGPSTAALCAPSTPRPTGLLQSPSLRVLLSLLLPRWVCQAPPPLAVLWAAAAAAVQAAPRRAAIREQEATTATTRSSTAVARLVSSQARRLCGATGASKAARKPTLFLVPAGCFAL